MILSLVWRSWKPLQISLTGWEESKLPNYQSLHFPLLTQSAQKSIRSLESTISPRQQTRLSKIFCRETLIELNVMATSILKQMAWSRLEGRTTTNTTNNNNTNNNDNNNNTNNKDNGGINRLLEDRCNVGAKVWSQCSSATQRPKYKRPTKIQAWGGAEVCGQCFSTLLYSAAPAINFLARKPKLFFRSRPPAQTFPCTSNVLFQEKLFYLVEADLISWKVGVVAIFCGRSLGAVGGWLFDHLLGFLQPEEHSPQKITAGTSERLWDISSVGHSLDI